MKKLSLGLLTGSLFLVAGVVNLLARDFLFATVCLGVGAAFVLMEPSMRPPPEAEGMPRRRFRLSPRNIAALAMLLITVVALGLTLARNVQK
jgi:hypothetical protein